MRLCFMPGLLNAFSAGNLMLALYCPYMVIFIELFFKENYSSYLFIPKLLSEEPRIQMPLYDGTSALRCG